MPITRLSLSTIETALIPRSASSYATAGTDTFFSTVITSPVITSIARIAMPHGWFHQH
jgi:hypothetical protein